MVAGDHGNAQALGARIRVGLLELGIILLGPVEEIAGDDQAIDVEFAALTEDVPESGESLRMVLQCRQMQVSCDGYAQDALWTMIGKSDAFGWNYCGRLQSFRRPPVE